MRWPKVFWTIERQCPSCGSDALRRSQMRGFIERCILKVIGMKAFRCESCDRRQVGFPEVEVKREKEK